MIKLHVRNLVGELQERVAGYCVHVVEDPPPQTAIGKRRVVQLEQGECAL